MMFQRFFAKRPAALAGQALYTPLIEQARRPDFYLAGKVPDTTDGRFELYTLHLALLVRRLRGERGFIAEVRQALFDTFLDGLDAGLREMGVGDLSVPKKMRKMGSAIYGRFKSYDAALAAEGQDELQAVLSRTLYAGVEAAPLGEMAIYVRATDTALAATPEAALFDRPLPWPTPAFVKVNG